MIKERIIWIDYAKVMGLLLVIFAHLYTSQGTGENNVIRTYIYGFHMPFFFLISGALYKRKDSLLQSLEKNVRTLFIPYLFFNLFFAIIYGILNKNILQELYHLPSGIYFGKGTPCAASWFVFVLFCIKCIYDSMTFLKIEKISIPVILCITVLLSYWGIGGNYFHYKSILIGICFFHFGSKIEYFINLVKTQKSLCLILSVILFVLSFFCTQINGKVSMMSGSVGNDPCLFFVNALIGSMALLYLSSISSVKSTYITNMSIASIGIVLLHMFFVQIVRKFATNYITSEISIFIFYVLCSLIIYIVCMLLYNLSVKYIPFIWGKSK